MSRIVRYGKFVSSVNEICCMSQFLPGSRHREYEHKVCVAAEYSASIFPVLMERKT
jgi:hypothetical protein